MQEGQRKRSKPPKKQARRVDSEEEDDVSQQQAENERNVSDDDDPEDEDNDFEDDDAAPSRKSNKDGTKRKAGTKAQKPSKPLRNVSNARAHSQQPELVPGDDEDLTAGPAAGPSQPSQARQRRAADVNGAGPSGAGRRAAGAGSGRSGVSQQAEGTAAAMFDIPIEVDPSEVTRAKTLTEKVKSAYKDLLEELQGKQAVPSNERLDEATGALLRHMLFAQADKPRVPVPRQKLVDIVKAKLGQGVKMLTKATALVFLHAQVKALKVMGMELAGVGKTGGSGEDSAAHKAYVLRSVLPTAVRLELVDRAADVPVNGLALVVLALIQLTGQQQMAINEVDLHRQLSGLGVEGLNSEHPALGKVADVLDTLVRQKYLTCEMRQPGEPCMPPAGEGGALKVYGWGEAAYEEVGKSYVEDFIKRITGQQQAAAEAAAVEAA